MSTIFGGDTGMSYEDVQRKRKIAEALLAQNMRTPQNLPEGLNAIGRALAARSIEKKTGKAMEGLNAEADALFSSIFGGGSSAGGGASYPTSPAPIPKVGTSTEGEAIADDAMATLVRMGLVERGLPEHVAEGFVMNAKDESGLRTDINEIAPLVPGSRGGFGLMQWTGPRRVALEQEAARRGVDPSDLQLQLDTIVSELQGPEARAGQSILSTKDAPSAATAIVNDFLRPAPQHRASRAAAYSGGGGSSASGSAGGSPSVQQIAAALSNPIIRNDPGKVAILNAMLGQAMQASDPMRALEMERAQLELEQLRNPQSDATDDMREYQFAVSQGYPGTFQDFMTEMRRAGAANVTTTVGGETVKPLGTEGQILVTDPTAPGGYRVEIAPNSKMARELASEEEAARNADQAKTSSANLVLDEINIARDLIGGESALSPATGITGSLASRIDSTRAGALKNRLTTIKANIGFDKLQAMRDASPTGGALGQVSEFENRLLQAVFGSLEQAQRAEDILYNLDRLEQIYNRIINEGIPEDEARLMYRQIELGQEPQANEGAGNDLTPEERRYLGLE